VDARRLAFALLLLSWTATSAPALTQLRRPLHDTLAGFLPLRVWAGDVLRSGDWPLWYPYPRYGVPFTTLHLAANVFSPIGVALGAVLPYNVWTVGAEQALWRAVGLAGAFAFARRHLMSPVSSASVAAVFTGCGSVALTTQNGSVFPGLMTVPWFVLALDSACAARGVRDALAAGGVLAVSTLMLVTSGYPGTWLTAPALLFPYFVVLVAGRLRATALAALAVCVGGVLGAGLLAFLLWETATLSLFGGAVRNAMNPAQGALDPRGALALFLPNPSYLLGGFPANTQPHYLGAATVLFIAAGLLPAWVRRPAIRVGALTAGALLILACGAPLLNEVAQAPSPALAARVEGLPGELARRIRSLPS
jgi:hypothetical protein